MNFHDLYKILNLSKLHVRFQIFKIIKFLYNRLNRKLFEIIIKYYLFKWDLLFFSSGLRNKVTAWKKSKPYWIKF